MTPLIYVVDDDADLRDAILDTFEHHKLPAKGFARASDLLPLLDPRWPGVILTDIRMPGMTGLELLEEVRRDAPDVPVILFTGHADVPVAVQAMKSGVFEFLEKPVHPDHLHQVVLRALKMRHLQIEVDQLQRQSGGGRALNDRIIGRSKQMRFLRRDLLAVAPLQIPVLLWGEDGTGRALAARVIHDYSPQAPGEFVTVTCPALSPETIERMLFEPGGAVERAAQGSLFLQNPEALSSQMQAQLLRLFDLPEPPRIIAAVTQNPDDLRNQGQLRADLAYRINVAQIELPPLRQRGRDMFHLLEHFIRAAAARHNKPIKDLPLPDLEAVGSYHWPGNVRELQNMAEKLVIGLAVRIGDSPTRPLTETYDQAMERFERELLSNALIHCNGRKGEAADLLGIPRKRLYLRLKQCGLD